MSTSRVSGYEYGQDTVHCTRVYSGHACVSPCELVMAGQGWSVISGECEVGREAEHAEI